MSLRHLGRSVQQWLAADHVALKINQQPGMVGGGTPLVPALGSYRQADVFEFKASLLHSEFQYNQYCIERPCLNNN